VVLALFACHNCLLSLIRVISLFSCGLRTLNVGCRRVDPAYYPYVCIHLAKRT